MENRGHDEVDGDWDEDKHEDKHEDEEDDDEGGDMYGSWWRWVGKIGRNKA